MLHLFSFLGSLLLFAGLSALILRELRGEAERIVAALVGTPVPVAARPWPARVRLVSAPRPSGLAPDNFRSAELGLDARRAIA